MTPIVQAAAVALVALGGGATAVTVMTEDVPDFAVPAGSWQPGHELDGGVFNITGVIAESGEELPETLFTFRDGTFQSSRCQVYCDFGWSGYQTWAEGETLHFTTTTRCPDAPHTVVWYGTVTGDEMRIAGTWTTRRWYWTRQINPVGEGAPVTPGGEATAG